MIKLIDILNEVKVKPSNTGMKKFFYLFVDGDGNLELDKEEFGRFISLNINKIKSLWNTQGGDWDSDNITQDEIDQSVTNVWKIFSTVTNYLTTSAGTINQKMNIKDFSKEDENDLIESFLTMLHIEINK
jgi:hypothetical protein